MKRLELWLGAALVALVLLTALGSRLWTPHDPTMPAGARLQPPLGEFALGTDAMGRDLLSRLMAGAQSTVYVGVIAVGIAVLVGVPLGIVAAQLRGKASEVLLRATDVAQAFPALLLAILLAGLFGGSTETAMAAIGLASIPQFLRVARAGTLQVLASDYVLAARGCGIGRVAIARTHVLPNIAPLLGVQATVSFAMAILAEAALSYLGLGTRPPTPTWGSMLQDAQKVWYGHPEQAVIPGVAIALAVLGFNLLGDGLRERLDPRLREEAP